MKYKVTACSIDIDQTFILQDAKINTMNNGTGNTLSDEIIDTETNSLYVNCKSKWDVADKYEAFWNRLDESDEDKIGNCIHHDARIVVLNVVEIREK